MADIEESFNAEEMRYAESLSACIQCKTISDKRFFDKKEFDKFREYVFKRYPRLADCAEYQNFDGGIFMRIRGASDKSPLVLMSHYDVVPENGKWERDAWSGEIKDGVVWGRGAVDTKGSLVGIFEAVESLIAEGYKFKTDLYILSSSKEEIAGNDIPSMVKWFRDNGVKPRLVIDEGGGIIDPPVPGVKGKYAMVGMVERSSARLLLETKSAGGKTAMERLSQYVVKASATQFGKRDFGPVNTAMFNAMKPNMNCIMKFIFGNLWLFKPMLIKLLPRANKAAAQILGPTVAFVSPTDAENLDLAANAARIVARVSANFYNKIDDVVKEFTAHAESNGVTVKVLSSRETPNPEPLDSDGYKFTGKIVGEVFNGVTISPYAVLGGTDARHFIGVADSVIRFAPIYMNAQQFGSFHNVNENINVSSIVGAVRFYREVIKQF